MDENDVRRLPSLDPSLGCSKNGGWLKILERKVEGVLGGVRAESWERMRELLEMWELWELWDIGY